MRDSGWDQLPPDVRFAGKPAEMRAPPWITACPHQLLTEIPSCEAVYMAAPERFAEKSDSSCTAGTVHTWLHRDRGNPPSDNRPYTWLHPNASQKRQICSCNAGTVHTWPILFVSSTGRCNTGIESLYWGFKSQCLTWPFVELTRHFIQMSLRVN